MRGFKKYASLVFGNNEIIAAVIFILFFISTLNFDRLMDLTFEINDWNEIIEGNLSYEQIKPYWSAMWGFYYFSILLLLSLASRSLIPIIWGTIVHHFAIYDVAYFIFNNLSFPRNFVYLKNDILVGVTKVLGFETLTPQALFASSAIGIVIGILATFAYIKTKKIIQLKYFNTDD